MCHSIWPFLNVDFEDRTCVLMFTKQAFHPFLFECFDQTLIEIRFFLWVSLWAWSDLGIPKMSSRAGKAACGPPQKQFPLLPGAMFLSSGEQAWVIAWGGHEVPREQQEITSGSGVVKCDFSREFSFPPASGWALERFKSRAQSQLALPLHSLIS